MAKLTALRVKALKERGRYGDGQGLFLVVGADNRRSWVLRIQRDGRRRDFGLGSAHTVTLAKAREKAAAIREQLEAGMDPLQERDRKREIPTFREAAELVISEKQGGWRNAKGAAQWRQSLEAYAFPSIGDKRVSEISGPEVRDLLAEIWIAKQETARRVRQRVAAILDWSYSKGYREAETPLRAITRGLPSQKNGKSHYAAIAPLEAPAFVNELKAAPATTGRQCLLFVILTGARSGEARGATWAEIDMDAALWTIPAIRMKAGREHVVPLSAPALEVLQSRSSDRVSRSPLVFEGSKPGCQLSDMTLTKVMRDMGRTETVHGFRSTFRDWVSEETSFSGDIAEMALAHKVRNAVEAAYRRGNLLEKRRMLMAAWASYLTANQPSGQVVKLKPASHL